MKILCVEQFRELGGGQLSLLDVLPGFRERGWEVAVAIPGEGTLAERVRALHCDVELFEAPAYANGRKRAGDVARYVTQAPKVAHLIKKLLIARKTDLLYVNASRMLPMTSLVARRRSIPLVFHCHNRVIQRMAVTLLGTSLQLARALVISCSKYSAEPLRRYLPEKAVSVIYNGVADTQISQPAPARKFYRVGVIGRIEPEKGQMEFVEAARLLLRSFPNCQFAVVGAPLFGGLRYFERVVEASRGLPIEFPGWQSDIPAVLSSLDVLVVPSGSLDSTPRVILEAFAAGVPVVAFPSGGIPEIVRDGKNGFLTATSTPAALAQRIGSVLQLDECSRRCVVTNARNCWRDRHSLEGFRRQVTDFVARAAGCKQIF
jgi:glycosyltransferase involved in cell wall biosynthesis